MLEPLKAFTTAVSDLFTGGSGRRQDVDSASPATSQASTTNYTPVPNAQGYKGAHPTGQSDDNAKTGSTLTAHGTRKRAQDTDLTTNESNKRIDRRGAVERRLCGDYHIPSDAVVFNILPRKVAGEEHPTPSSSAVRRKMPNFFSRPPFKPTNTLNKPSPQAPKGYPYDSTSQKRLPGPRRVERQSSPVIAIPATRTHGDGFEAGDRSSKRRKLEVAQSKAPGTSNTVDLTHDEDEDRSMAESEAIALSEASWSNFPFERSTSHVLKKPLPRFAATELDNVDRLIHPKTINPRPKSRGSGKESSESSPRPVPYMDPLNGTGKLGATVDIEPQSPPSPKLRQMFKRDIGEGYGEEKQQQQRLPTPPVRQRAPDRMKVTSQKGGMKVSPIRDSFGSVDELAGDITVGARHTLRNVSPVQEDSSRSFQPHSPSDIKQTHFTSTDPQKGQPKADPRGKSVKESPDDIRIPIQWIWSRGCIAEGNKHELVWNDDDRVLFVVEGPEGCLNVPHKPALFSIGRGEARFVYENKALRTMYIKGAVSDNSNGSILIEFVDADGASKCLGCLTEAANNSLKYHHIDTDRMWRIVDTQRDAICNDHHKQKQLNSRKNEGFLPIEPRRAARDEQNLREQIHGNETEGRPARLRWRMQPSNTPLEENMSNHEPTRSKYFPERRVTRRSTRQREPSEEIIERWTHVNKPARWAHPVVYPSEGLRRVTVDFEDLERLDEGEFLNDSVISFALRQTEEKMPAEHRANVHFFNSFFYSALIGKSGRGGRSCNYDAVKRWTKKEDIFSYPYVVVPINIDLHWFVAIICNLPNLSRKLAGSSDDGGNDKAEEQSVPVRDEVEDVGPIHEGSPTAVEGTSNEQKVTTQALYDLSLSDNESINPSKDFVVLGDSQEVVDPKATLTKRVYKESLASKKKARRMQTPPTRRYDPDVPAIITLDSFGSGHSVETRVLKEYLSAEADAKRGMTIDTTQLQGMTAKGIPEQTNFCDCGLYLVGYVEEFAKDPRKFVTKALTKQMDRESDFASFDPSRKREDIRNALLELQSAQDSDRMAKKKDKSVAGKPSGNAVLAEGGRGPEGARKTGANDTGKHATGATTGLDRPEKRTSYDLSSGPVTDNSDNPVGVTDSGTEDDYPETTVPRALDQHAIEETPRAVQKASLAPREEMAYSDGAGEMLDQDSDTPRGLGRILREAGVQRERHSVYDQPALPFKPSIHNAKGYTNVRVANSSGSASMDPDMVEDGAIIVPDPQESYGVY